jgi:hypothetical protein
VKQVFSTSVSCFYDVSENILGIRKIHYVIDCTLSMPEFRNRAMRKACGRKTEKNEKPWISAVSREWRIGETPTTDEAAAG